MKLKFITSAKIIFIVFIILIIIVILYNHGEKGNRFNSVDRLRDKVVEKIKTDSSRITEIKAENKNTFLNKEKHNKIQKHLENCQSSGIPEELHILDDSSSTNKIIEKDSSSKEIVSLEIIHNPTSPKIIQIPSQVILQGEKFISLDLNMFVIDSIDKPEEIKWTVSNSKNLNVKISLSNKLIIDVINKDWFGVDTILLTAVNSANLFSSTKIVLEVREVELIDRYPIKPIKDVLVIGVEDVLSLVINPVKWNTEDIIFASSILAGTLALTTLDKRVQDEIIKNGSYSKNTLLDVGKFYGETYTSQLAGVGVALYGIASSDKKATRIGLEIFESYLIADRINYLIKHMFGRERPFTNKGELTFNLFTSRSNSYNSLPSGHATLAFSLSTVLSSCTDDYYLKALIFAPAVLSAVSRVYQNYHWASDVFLGGAVGFIVGNYLVNRHNNIISNKLSFGFDGQGRVGFVYRF
ncbi:MAG: phosphatase PAP2 family protein [Ignavibacteriales bacterium]|nr:phosphatase PAP2 family protein [Ignavibacteriales bacterium]